MAPKAPREVKRKAGGEGKKGKKFLENKEGLLSLIGDVTQSKESIRQSKLDKHRSYAGDAAPASSLSGSNLMKKKEVTPMEKRKREKDRALVSCPYLGTPTASSSQAEAKAALAAKAKEKKQRGKATAAPAGSAGPAATASPKAGKKRVGFA